MSSLPGNTSATHTRSLRVVTLALTALAVIAVEMALDAPRHSPIASILKSVGMMASALAAARVFGRRNHDAALPRSHISALSITALLPVIHDCIGVALMNRGWPLETLLLCVCRNLALWLAALSAWRLCLRLAGLMSLFLVLFSSSLVDGWAALAVVGAYAATACVWLMLLHWEGAATRDAGHAPFPAVAAGVLATLLGGVVAAATLGPNRIASALGGFLPSSGGTRYDNDLARGGIGDGIDEIAGSKDPSTVGYDNSDVFVNSEKCGLYDSFVERFGEAVKPTEFKKMFFLKRSEIKLSGNSTTEDLRAGKSFSLARQAPRPSVAAEHAADALLLVKGDTPLHLRLTAYDHFDGVAWAEASLGQLGCTIENEPGGSWMALSWLRQSPIFASDQDHQIRIGRLNTDRLPTPAHLARFRVGRVNRADFFGWAQPGIVRMAKRSMPSGTVIDTVCHTVDPSRLSGVHFPSANPDSAVLDPAVAALAHQWVAGIPRGWGQIQSLIEHLRSHCTLDQSRRNLPADGDIIGDFLFHARSGPDYLFASTATLMLRDLGYPSRLVAGFYADPTRYDRSRGQTPLTSRDAHFWAEVRLPDGAWVTLEPTPGYRVAGPARSWAQRLGSAVRDWTRLHAVSIAGLVAGLLALWRFRWEAADAAITLGWWAGAGRSARHRVLETLRLLERRFGMAGRARPPGLTPLRWLNLHATAVPAVYRADLSQLAALANWAAYAPERKAETHWNQEALSGICRRLGWKLTARRLRHAARAFPKGTTQ